MAVTTHIPNSKSKSLDDWKTAIRAGIRYRQVFGQSIAWDRYKNMYRGFWKPGTQAVNLISSIAHSIITQTYFRDMRINVEPTFPGFTPNAWIIESIDNYLIREQKMKKEFKSMILRAFLCGTAAGSHGYDSEWGYDPGLAGDSYGEQTESSHNKKGDRIEYNTDIKSGMPWFKAMNTVDFIVPWGTADWAEAQWYGMRKMRPLQDWKDDPKYENTSTLMGQFENKMDGFREAKPEPTIKSQSEDNRLEWVEGWEIHDKKSGEVIMLSLGHDQFLRKEEDLLQMEGLPADILFFNEDPDFFWGVPDARLIEPQQLDLNDIRTMAKKHRQVAILKMLVDKSMLKDDEISKLLNDEVKAVAMVDAGPGGDIRKSVAFLQSHVPPDFDLAARAAREDVREIIGFSRNQSGSFEAPSGRRTAKEATIVQAASVVRLDERRDFVADLLTNVMRKQNQIIFKTWTEERVIDIVGPKGSRLWVKFTGPEIASEMKYKINPEETLPQDQRSRRAEAVEVLEVLKATPGVNQAYLIRQFVQQYDWLDPRMLFPEDEGAGRSPEKAISVNELRGQTEGLTSSQPGLA